MARVLVTDGQQRKALAAVRSLGRAGHHVTVAEEMLPTTAFFSRHAAARAVYPSPSRRPVAFAAWMEAYVRRHRIDIVLPMDDHTTAAAVQSDLPCAALLPSAAAFAVFRDKAATVEAAARAGVAVPASAVADEDPGAALRQAEGLGYPLVVKPRVSSGGRGMSVVRRPADLPPALASAGSQPLLQQWIGPGPQLDVCMLYGRDGQRVASFVQREIRHYPLVGGPSTLQESVVAPELVALTDGLLRGVGWTGPAEVEFRLDAGGRPWLMEVNPRYWASLALAIRAGIDFPVLQVAAALGGAAEPERAYQPGLRCRWLLPGDILHYLHNPRRREMDPPFWRTYDRRTFDDVLDRSDPGPAAGFALAAAYHLLHPTLRRRIIR